MAEIGLQSAERFTSGDVDEAERAGPVATAFAKRMRWANKRMDKIQRTEEKARLQPDNLNEDQRETLASKAGTLAISEELKRLIPLVEEAKKEEVDAAVQKAVEKALAEERATVAAQRPPTPKQPEGVSQEHRSQVEEETLNRLLPLLYFSQTFDFDKPGSMVELERGACLSFYNHHFPERDGELTPDDLLLMCKLGSLLMSRNTNECISHAESLQRAQGLATQWLHPTSAPVDLLNSHTMEDVSGCLKRVMASDYITVRPVLAQNTSSADSAPVHVPEDGQHSSESRLAHSGRPHIQERPETPDLPQQDSHIFSDTTRPTDSSSSPSPQQHQEPGKAFHPSPDGYSQHEAYPTQEGGLHPSQQNGYLQQPGQAVHPGQGYGQDSVSALNFMTAGSATAGTTGDALPHEQASLNPRSSQQHPGHADLADSSFTNGPLPSEGINGIIGQSEGSSVPVQAALSGPQASYGTRQRGDGGGRPERQGSGFRGNSRGRRGGRGDRGDAGGRPRGRGRGDGSKGRSDRGGRGGYDQARGDGSDGARGNTNGYDHTRNAPNGYGSAKGGQGSFEQQSTW